MPLSPSDFIDQSLTIGRIYYIDAPEFGIDDPHFYIVIARDEDINYFVVCTTKIEAVVKRYQKMGYNMNTIVELTPDRHNLLREISYVDCNQKFEETTDKLILKRSNGRLTQRGVISYEQYNKLRDAIKLSDYFDLPHDMLVHPDDEGA